MNQVSQSDEQSLHPRDNSIPSEVKEEQSQQNKDYQDHESRPPSPKIQLYVLAALLCASIASGDFRLAVLNAIVGYVIVNILDRLRKAVKK